MHPKVLFAIWHIWLGAFKAPPVQVPPKKKPFSAGGACKGIRMQI